MPKTFASSVALMMLRDGKGNLKYIIRVTTDQVTIDMNFANREAAETVYDMIQNGEFTGMEGR